jgi:hypothetical protein
VAELGGEKVDIIPWSDDPAELVANALSPAQVVGVRIDEESGTATVTVPERMLSLAIGREGQNARLAAKLTGRRIDIRSDAVAAEPAEPEAIDGAALSHDANGVEAVIDVTSPGAPIEATETLADAAPELVAVGAEAGPAAAVKPKRASRAKKAVVAANETAPVAAEVEPAVAEAEPAVAVKPKRASRAKKAVVGEVAS